MRIWLLVFLIVASPLRAETPRTDYRGEDFHCDKITAPVQEAACLEGLADSYKALDKAYISALSGSPAEQRPFLEKDQSSWLAYRDAHCLYESAFYPNSGGPATQVGCIAGMNKQRAQALDGDTRLHD